MLKHEKKSFASRHFNTLLFVIAVIALPACGRQRESVGVQDVELAPEPAVASAPAPERHVDLAGQPNFRDLGGYETADGRTVKWSEVYRSGELPHLTDEDVATLEELEIRTVVNFLLPEEIEMNGRDRLPEGARELPEPIQGDRAAELTMVAQTAIKSADFDKIPPQMNPEFHSLLLDEGKEQYAALLRLAADPANRPLAFHCSHGVHRTGTATAILLSALGVPWETVREDYLLTNEYRREEVEATLAKIRQMAAQKMGIPPDEVDMTNVEAFYILQGFYIDGALDAAIENYGSMAAYIREGLGLKDEEIEQLRNQLLE
ncbi:MAG: tyrosine-protein phosphatase [Thermoanaerobaculia bacterium]